MTPRSPNQQHPKTTTISRRLRNRAVQNLSAQPPPIPRLRSVRPRRAATLPTSRHEPSHFQPLESHQPSTLWETEELAEDLQHSLTSNPARIVKHQPVDALTLDFGPYDSAQSSRIEVVSATEPHTAQEYGHHQASASETSPLPLPSVSGSNVFELPLSTDPQQPHNPFIDLQDMR